MNNCYIRSVDSDIKSLQELICCRLKIFQNIRHIYVMHIVYLISYSGTRNGLFNLLKAIYDLTDKQMSNVLDGVAKNKCFV